MKYIEFHAIGFKGFKALLGLNEIHINFKKSKNKIIAIKGPNGCGKSTLIGILNMFPDPIDKIIPEQYGEKSGVLENENSQYSFTIKYPINTKGKRESTKAYISKYINGSMVEMNPNGNISSYKEYIYNEFSVDPAFILLTSLSISNKGIVDKTPTERKKYVSILIKAVEDYNGYLKTLNKRRSNLKAVMNNISSKINIIGDEKEITLTLESINNRLNNITKDKDEQLQLLSESKSKIKILDPNGSIQETYKKIYDNLVSINDELSGIKGIIDKQISKIPEKITKENISEIYNTINNNIIKYKMIISNNEKNISDMLNDREKESKDLAEKSAKLDSLNLSISDNNIISQIDECRSLINEYEVILKEIGIKDIFSISKEEFIMGLESLYDIKETILQVRKELSQYTIEQSAKIILEKRKNPDINYMTDQLNDLRIKENSIILNLEKYSSLLKETEKLKNRDKNCNIDTCGFIQTALEAEKKNPQYHIDNLSRDLSVTKDNILKLENDIQESKEIISCMNYLKSICKSLSSSIMILKKLPIDMNIFGSDNYILRSILNGYRFEEVDYLYKYIQYSNIIEEYKIQINKLELLNKDYDIYLEKSKIVDEIIQNISIINNRINESTVKITSLTNENISLKDDIIKSETILSYIESLKELFKKEDVLLNNKRNILSEYNKIKSDMVEIKSCVVSIRQLESSISILESQIKPLIKDRDTLNHQLSMTKEYKLELDKFNKQMTRIETLRKYCNPTEDEAIQLLFIELYFYNTIKLCNELLLLVFNGRYQLQKPSILGDEFKIPVTGNMLPCDDISSMSESQRSLIGIILSFVLIFQSSPKFNIVSLDEVDESLDLENRLAFGILLDNLISRFGFEQLFYVSHNEEVVLQNADIILLTDREDIKVLYKDNNIIFSL